jgi:anti-sigma factor RsiW
MTVRFALDHRWAHRHMSASLDGELGAGARARMQRHTAACAGCRELRDGLARMVDVLRSRPPMRAPAGLWSTKPPL